MKYFGTDGIRGIVGEKLTPELAQAVGYAYGMALNDYLGGLPVKKERFRRNILIGRDTRSSGQMLAAAVCAGLKLAGFNVIDAGIITTPAHNYETKVGDFVGGVMITASHNPAEHNGIKLCADSGKKHSLAFLESVEEYIDKGIPAKINTEILGTYAVDFSIGLDWIGFILRSLGNPDLSGFTVALDLANGAGYELIPEGFRRAGAKVLTFNTECDGKNINNGCGSVYVDRFTNKVVESGADIGFSFDGDADRIMVVDRTGRVVDGADLMYIFGVYYSENGKLNNGAIVTTPITNLGMEYSLNKKSIEVKRTQKVGGQYVQALMEDGGYLIGGEENGHMLLNDIGEGSDGMCVGLYLLKIMRESGCDLCDLLSDMERTKTAQSNVDVSEEQKQKYVAGALSQLEAEQAARLKHCDGRIIVRPSGTECVIRVLVEGEEQLLLDEICGILVDAIKKL